MKNNLSFEKELEGTTIKNLSFDFSPSIDIYSILHNLYFNIMQEPVPINSLPYLYQKIDKPVLSLYHKDPSTHESSSLSSSFVCSSQDTKEEELDFITTFKNLNKDVALIKKDLIQDEEQIFNVFNVGFDSFYLYASSLDTARLQYFIEIGREFKTEVIVLISSIDEAKKVLLTDTKIIGVTNRNHHNQPTSTISPKRDLFEYLIDHKPQLVLVHDID